MARPRGSNPDKLDRETLRRRRMVRERRTMSDLRLAAGRKRVWVEGPDGKIREKWI